MITAWWLYCGSGVDATASEPPSAVLTSAGPCTGARCGAWSSAAELDGFDDEQDRADDQVAA
jgi:hypothetical protein